LSTRVCSAASGGGAGVCARGRENGLPDASSVARAGVSRAMGARRTRSSRPERRVLERPSSVRSVVWVRGRTDKDTDHNDSNNNNNTQHRQRSGVKVRVGASCARGRVPTTTNHNHNNHNHNHNHNINHNHNHNSNNNNHNHRHNHNHNSNNNNNNNNNNDNNNNNNNNLFLRRLETYVGTGRSARPARRRWTRAGL